MIQYFVAKLRFVAGYAKAMESARQQSKFTQVISTTQMNARFQVRRIPKLVKTERIPVFGGGFLASTGIELRIGNSWSNIKTTEWWIINVTNTSGENVILQNTRYFENDFESFPRFPLWVTKKASNIDPENEPGIWPFGQWNQLLFWTKTERQTGETCFHIKIQSTIPDFKEGDFTVRQCRDKGKDLND